MQDRLMQILVILGSLGLFLYGMKCMSEALQKVAGVKMRRTIETMTSTTIRRITAGCFITAVIQSSSAITVMIVSFVNAGLLSLAQSIGMIMGANIGTTITAWIIALVGFQINLDTASIPLIGLGFLLTLFKRENIKSTGNIIIGFALLFLSINILRLTMSSLTQDSMVLDYLSRFSDHGLFSALCFLSVGALLTFVIQSSSATIALTIILCSNGWISFECGAAMILGENIGTTATANIAAYVTNANAKRAALSHTLFNLIGVLWALPLLHLLTAGVAYLTYLLTGTSPISDQTSTPIGLAMFHTIFNLLNTMLLVWFIPFMSKAVTSIIKDRVSSPITDKLQYLNSGILSTGDISLIQVQRELINYAHRVSKMFHSVRSLFREHNSDSFMHIYQQIEQQEHASDVSREELYDYLSRTSTGNIGFASKRNIEVMFRIVSDIEIMSDYNYSLSKLIKSKKERGIWFNPQLREGLNGMFDLIEKAILVMNHNLSTSFSGTCSIEEASEVEQAINSFRTTLKNECLDTGEHEEHFHKAELIFSDLISRSEQLGDIIVHISEDAMQLKSDYQR